jgi:hypothetical protein
VLISYGPISVDRSVYLILSLPINVLQDYGCPDKAKSEQLAAPSKRGDYTVKKMEPIMSMKVKISWQLRPREEIIQ